MSPDQTSYGQSLTHLIKGNLGAGILAMPASFAHTGLLVGMVGLPFLCLLAVYCIHILIKASQLIESKSKNLDVNYSNLASQVFDIGPKCLRSYGKSMSRLVDGTLLVTQVGVCCIYIVFLVDNVTSILASYHVHIAKPMVFLAILPFTILLSFIRTLKRLALASMFANILQTIGLALIAEFLIRDLDQVNLSERDNYRPFGEMALGFGSAMFAFEGISVVLPIYSRMKNPKRMSNCLGVVNVSFCAILLLYFCMGVLGYLKFGHHVRDSITLNLPAEPLYDGVRAMFTMSILLSYPLQFYVPNEIVWIWAKKNLLKPSKQELSVIRAIEVVIPPAAKMTGTFEGISQSPKAPGVVSVAQIATPGHSDNGNGLKDQSSITTTPAKSYVDDNHKSNVGTPNDGPTIATCAHIDSLSNCASKNNNDPLSFCHDEDGIPLKYEYYCRCIVVSITFAIAFSVPKLNLLMDLIGSLTGACLSLTIPAALHLVAFWDETKGSSKATMIIIDSSVIIFSLIAGSIGSISSLISIANSFH